jgi:hypothetical protein
MLLSGNQLLISYQTSSGDQLLTGYGFLSGNQLLAEIKLG